MGGLKSFSCQTQFWLSCGWVGVLTINPGIFTYIDNPRKILWTWFSFPRQTDLNMNYIYCTDIYMPGQLCASRYTRVEVRYTYKHIQGQIDTTRYTQTEFRYTYIIYNPRQIYPGRCTSRKCWRCVSWHLYLVEWPDRQAGIIGYINIASLALRCSQFSHYT